MNNFETIEKLWRQQPSPVSFVATQSRSTEVLVERDPNRQGRILKWGVACTAFGLLATPFFTIVNHLSGAIPVTAFGVAYLAIFEAAYALLLIALVRRIQGQRKVLQKSASNVRENLSTTLEVIEMEMADYRKAAWQMPLLALLTLASLAHSYHVGKFDLTGFVGRSSAVLGFTICVGAVALRHYRAVLLPQWKRLRELLSEFALG